MPKKQRGSVEGAAQRLRELLAQVEEGVQELTGAVERDERGDLDPVRAELARLHEQALALHAKAGELLERANDVLGAAEAAAQRGVDNGAEFVSAFEDLVSGLESAAETLDPQNWEWDDQRGDGP